MALRPQTFTPGNLVEKHINTAYDTVRSVAENLDAVTEVAGDITNGNIDAAIAAVDLTAANLAATDADTIATAADLVATNQDTIDTATDLVATNQDTIDTAADAAATAADVITVAAIYDSFDDRYLGAKGSDPTLDNDGDALGTGALYFNTSLNQLKIYDGANWSVAPQIPGIVSNADATAITIDSGEKVTFSENIGIGVTPDTLLSSFKAIQLGGNAYVAAHGAVGAGLSFYFSQNTYRDTGGTWIHKSTDEASRYDLANGGHSFLVAPSDTAGNAVSFTTALFLDATANATFGGNISLANNRNLYLGDSDDLRLFHDGSNSHVFNYTGQLFVDNYTVSGLTSFRNDDSSGNQKTCMIIGGATPSVQLFFNGGEKFRTISTGVEIGTLSASGATSGVKIQESGFTLSSVTTTANSNHRYFYNPNGVVGSIQTSGTATAYNTTSDKRLKTSQGLLINASSLVSQIEIHDYHFNTDESLTLQGVMAQDLYEVYPQAVSKPDKEEDVWSVDYSKLVPLLIASVQELEIRIKQLE